MLNLLSFILGIIAIIFAIANILNKKFSSMKMFDSMSSCSVSLCLQVIEINSRVQKNDWSALLDTMGTLTVVTILFVVITIVLNAIPIILKKPSIK